MRQLELTAGGISPGRSEAQQPLAPSGSPRPVEGARDSAPRVLALCFPDLPLQRMLRQREAAKGGAPERRPLAVERDGLVVSCDAEARAHGVRRGDSLVQARAACSELEAVPASAADDRAALEALAEVLLTLTPAVEVASPDELLLDATGAGLLARVREQAEAALADRAIALAAGLGLRCRAAVADGRGPARALARHGASDARVVARGAAAALGVLPLAALDLPAGIHDRLAALGLRQVGELARLPPEALAHRFGAPGLAAWRLAHGEDPSPLVPYVPRRLPEEQLELEVPVDSAEPLLFGARRLCDRLAARLAGRGLGATRLVLLLALDGARDAVREERLEIALAAPSITASSWVLVLRERLGALRLSAAVRAMVLTVAEAATAPVEQLALGDRPEQLLALESVLARLGARLGEGALLAAQPVDNYKPESAYRARSFAARRRRRAGVGREGASVAKDARRKAGRDVDATATVEGPPASHARPTRLLPRPQPLVALGEGGRLTALRVGGRTLRVLALSPPERLAGEWWGDPFDRDYYRARIEGLGECWIFRDAGGGRLWLHGLFD